LTGAAPLFINIKVQKTYNQCLSGGSSTAPMIEGLRQELIPNSTVYILMVF
jgi:hypothetical protein